MSSEGDGQSGPGFFDVVVPKKVTLKVLINLILVKHFRAFSCTSCSNRRRGTFS
jgi:hypothetical protein